MLRRTVSALVLSLILSSAAVAQNGAPESYRQYVGRLITARGRCTAFPIHNEEFYNPYAANEIGYRVLFLTAGHCVTEVMHYEQPTVVVDFGSNSVRMSPTSIPVRAIAVSPIDIGYDLAVLGAVTLYPLPTLEIDGSYEPSVGEPLLQVGFGRGAWMARVGPFQGWNGDGMLVVWATASKGNSGGPVIVPGTKKVIGVGVHTSLAPGSNSLSCLLAACPPVPPFYATSVRRLPGLIRWPPKVSP